LEGAGPVAGAEWLWIFSVFVLAFARHSGGFSKRFMRPAFGIRRKRPWFELFVLQATDQSLLPKIGSGAVMEKVDSKLTFGEKVSYGLGDTASNFYWQMFLNFLAFFYTDVFGITAAAAATMLLVVRIPDTFIDPVMGIIADRTKTRWGHYRPYLLWGCFPMAIIGVAMFHTPSYGPQGKLVYAYITYALIMLAYTFINIPYGALMGVISSNSLERTSVSSYRFVLAYFGLFMVQGLTIPMVKFFGKGNDQIGFEYAMGVFGVLAIILFLTTFALTKERVQPMQQKANVLKDDLKDLFKNVPWVMVCFIGVFAVFYISIRMGAILYYFKYCIVRPGELYRFDYALLGHRFTGAMGPEALASWFMAVGTAGVIFGASMARPLCQLLGGKRRAYMILMSTASILTVLFYFVPLSNVPLVFAVHIAISTLFAPTSPLLWAFYADTADYSEWKSGRRATGLVFSAASFSQKLGWALGSSLFLGLIGFIGFHANIQQSPNVQTGIRYMMSFFPAVLGFLSAGAVIFYKLDDTTMKQIEIDLKQRRSLQA
jgi:GPH family glycoside/pentoside/hexuronide:cation symporter